MVASNIEPPENTRFDSAAGVNTPSLSPDGTMIALVARADSKTQLWVRAINSAKTRSLTGTDGAQFPFWSPDSRSIAFFADAKLKRIDAAGGPVLTLADAPKPAGGSWSPGGVIVFAPNNGIPLQRVSAGGGTSTSATRFDGAN